MSGLNRKVEVVRLQPGQDLPGDNSPNAPFYWTMEHDRRFCTFIDSFTKPPPSLALYANQKEPRVRPLRHAGIRQCIL